MLNTNGENEQKFVPHTIRGWVIMGSRHEEVFNSVQQFTFSDIVTNNKAILTQRHTRQGAIGRAEDK